MPTWPELLITGLLIALLMATCFYLGKAVAYRRLADDVGESNLQLYRRFQAGQTLFRLTHSNDTLGTFFDSGWRPVAEHLMPDDAPDPDLSDS